MDKKAIDNLLKLNVNDRTEKKNGLTYLSWSWAWAEMLGQFPDATYTVAKNTDGTPMFGNNKIGWMCYTTVTAGGVTHEMWLPVMDHRNKAILEPNMFDVNKTIMRCLTKNLAMFGLGLYIYSGEDLPEGDDNTTQPQNPVKQANAGQKTPQKAPTLITPEQAADFVAKATEHDKPIQPILDYLKLSKLEDMTIEQYNTILAKWSK